METVEVVGKDVGRDVRLGKVSVEEYVNDPIVREGLGGHGPGRWWDSGLVLLRL